MPGLLGERADRRLDRLAALGAREGDGEQERLNKAVLTLTASLACVVLIPFEVVFALRGVYGPVWTTASYQAVTIAGIAHLYTTKRLAPFRDSQIVVGLITSFVGQVTAGGYQAGAILLWGMIVPLAGLIFYGPKRARWVFAAYAALAVAAAFVQPHVHPRATLGPAYSDAFVTMTLITVSFVGFLMMRYFVRSREQARAALDEEHHKLEVEQERSERLLLNVLPASIAARLKEREEVIADAFGDVTVLFADIAGFTPFADRTPPEELVAVLDRLFSEFDELAERHGLEKIKTIGDAYMVAGGLPEPHEDHADAVASMALEMRRAVQRRREAEGLPFALRIGMHSGPVVAGVIGRRKFIYDLWGDTVNTASRMESHGIPGEIQVSSQTYRLLRGRYRFKRRGTIDVKGKGPMAAYLLLGPAPLRQPGLTRGEREVVR